MDNEAKSQSVALATFNSYCKSAVIGHKTEVVDGKEMVIVIMV